MLTQLHSDQELNDKARQNGRERPMDRLLCLDPFWIHQPLFPGVHLLALALRFF